MKRILKWTFGIVGSLVLLLLVTVLLVLVRPELLVNDRALPWASRMVAKAGISLKWSEGHIEIESLSFFEKRLKLNFTDLCVLIPSQGVDACFEYARVTAAGGLIDWKLRITEIGPADILGAQVAYTVQESPPGQEPAPEQKPEKGELIPEIISRARILPIIVKLPDWKFTSDGTKLSGRLDLDSKLGKNGSARIELDTSAALTSNTTAPQQFEAKALFENPRGFFETEGWRLGLDAKARLADGSRANANVTLDPRVGAGPMAYAYAVKGEYLRGKARIQGDLAGELAPDLLIARINADARGLVPNLSHAWIKGCEIKLSREASEARPGALKMNCPVFAEVPLPPKGFPKIALPAYAGVKLIADLRSGAFPPNVDAPVDGKISMELDPILSPIFRGGGKVESQVAGVPKNFPTDWKMDTDLGLKLKVANFERLVKQLSDTPFDLWAPIRVLKGEVEVGLHGRFDANSGSAPVHFQTRLVSPGQKLDIDASGNFKIERLRPTPRMSLALDVVLSDVMLQLPPLPELPRAGDLSPDPLPQLFPDNRFVSMTPMEKSRQKAGMVEEPLFTYDVRIHTASEASPVRLTTSQLPAPVPITVNVALKSDEPLSGGMKLLSFPIQLFKRNVTFEHLTISFRQPSKDSEIDGRIVVPYTQYTITILLLGTTDRPQIKFLSDPPLPDDQIIAALMFGKPLDALDPDQQQSVGSSRAALRQGALNLFALRYLSSLNIESIDYDPDTKTASLRYSLAEGTTLNISQGTGGGQPSAGIRKRLSKHFAVTTTLNSPSPTQSDRTVSTFLEWAYQY